MSCLKEPLKTAPKTPQPQVINMEKEKIKNIITALLKVYESDLLLDLPKETYQAIMIELSKSLIKYYKMLDKNN